MVRVTIELLPFGSEDRKRHLGTIEISNDLTGTEKEGNYKVRLSKFGKPESTWRKGVVRGFDRKKRGPFDLLLLALQATVGDRLLTGEKGDPDGR